MVRITRTPLVVAEFGIGTDDDTERAAYLDSACPDPQQRERVEKLLAALGRASDFLERPAAAPPTHSPRASLPPT